MKFLFKIFITGVVFVYGHHAFAATANISNLVFTTEQRTVAPDTVSSSIIIQAENNGGAAEPVDETNDVTFNSTSSSGQFLNSSGNPVSTTMNKNTSSRTFFYKDAVIGTHTITVTITGRITGKIFSASQQIIVGTTSSSSATTATSTAITTDSATSTPSADSDLTLDPVQNTQISAHSNSEDISNFRYAIQFAANAGRERIAAINAPVTFEAEVGNFSDNPYARVECDWSFGDGTMATGKSVRHTYAFPGEYNVVLNVRVGDARAVSRSKVRVIEPRLSLVQVVRGPKGFVEIRNDSLNEVNLQSFKVRSGDENYIFAPDTIMSPHTVTKFPFAFSSKINSPVILLYPEGEVVESIENVATVDSVSELEGDFLTRRAQAQKRLEEYIRNANVQIERYERNETFEPEVIDRSQLPLNVIESSGTENLLDAMEESRLDQAGISLFDFLKSFVKK